ncbi:CAP domain-containing protein [Vibrio splendidus]|uniref:CAP domain-containing protein n=1 Tax=Vibrio splendidus TaxID=29497 RepID=UPI00148E0185|nr:CAP domain-containing protein [Vibrio splendidus]NOJ03333.1 CAP domain-containing protein [Vibrio splendidus]
MKKQNISAVALLALIITGCGGESSSGGDSTTSNNANAPSNPSNPSNPDSSSTSQQPDIKALSNNMIFAIEGFVDTTAPIRNYSSISVKNELPAFKGGDTQKVDVDIAVPTIVIDNGSNFVNDWHCYETTGLSAQRKSHQLLVDGTISEYRYDMQSNACSSELLGSYVFNDAVFDSSLEFKTVGSVVSKDENGVESNLPTYDFIAQAYGEQSKERFGDSWELLQRDKINAAAKEVGASIFELNTSSGKIDLDLGQLNSDTLIDFASLDTNQLLNGAIWGMPGQGVADEKWCRIVNIPEDLSQNSIKYQSVISTNCARSAQRYCDAFGSSFSSGNYPPAAPIAWDSNTASNAQLNSDEQYRRDAQGHFVVNSSGQNAFVLSSNSVVIPIFGYTSPRSDGQVNNAGLNSWAGHEGHCQNVMNSRHTKMGIGYKVSKSDTSKMSYWTQDFN